MHGILREVCEGTLSLIFYCLDTCKAVSFANKLKKGTKKAAHNKTGEISILRLFFFFKNF